MSFDIRKKPIGPQSPRHSKHSLYLARLRKQADAKHRGRTIAGIAFFAIFLFLSFNAVSAVDNESLKWSYTERSEIQKIRTNTLSRNAVLPVEIEDPKVAQIEQFLRDKKSPLSDYAGLIARMPNYRLILGIAQAESNLCKRTDRNNCWGIGPGGPWSYDDISNSLYHVNYLLDRYQSLGMDRPENMVNTYVGYHNPNWIQAVNDIFIELNQRGL
jgi:hypothetical protein